MNKSHSWTDYQERLSRVVAYIHDHCRQSGAAALAPRHGLLGQWLVRSGHEEADLPMFEDNLNNPSDTAPADLLTDIYLPLVG